MKVGMRTPSIKKYVSARTTGRIKREAKSAINPLYGKKGIGWVNDPKKAAYNKVYNKTTFSIGDVFSAVGGVFSLIGSVLMILISLIQVLFYGAILVFLIYIVYLIITL
ncbi:MAG: hypothetical protein KIB43_08035 [Clostridium baratii]|uniref:hypothetical protein n=1 Tax=Clostridium baratii TaxID=1561 RepID=UPI00242BB8D1|nr:hypothetical protein [Clostridium baratii]MBS6006898.1 hypothetical protein [Clostridium baratii]MDU1053426.1 hypothetical protein [Clostridium baratii]